MHQPQEQLGFTAMALGHLSNLQAPGLPGGLQTLMSGIGSWESPTWVHPRSPEQVWEVWRAHLSTRCPGTSHDTGGEQVPTSGTRCFWEV